MDADDPEEVRRSEMAKSVFRRHRSRALSGGAYSGSAGISRRPRRSAVPATDESSDYHAGGQPDSWSEAGSPVTTDAATGEDGGTDQAGGTWKAPPGTYRSKTGTARSPWDPQTIGDVLSRETQRRGWEHTLSVASVSADWEEIVGPLVAQHCPIDSFEGGVLVAQADSTAWAQQLQLLLPMIQRRIDEKVGRGIVEKVMVRPPRAPSWVHGQRHVRGRGPRDTYG